MILYYLLMIEGVLTKEEYIELTIEEKLKFNGSIKVRCSKCEYLDYKEKNVYDYDSSRCPRCNHLILLMKRNKLIWNRYVSSSIEAINFLNREDMPDKIEGELYLRFDNREELLEFLTKNEIEGDLNIIF